MPVLSASQINAWRRCKRHWAFNYIGKHKPEPNKFAAVGLEVHKELERWLTEALPPQSPIALAGIKHLPQPGTPGLEVEQAIQLKTQVASYRGFIDFRFPDGDRYVVGDHKTTSGFQWAKQPEDLLSDTQSILYSASTMIQFGVETVDLRWVYYRTRGAPKAMVINQTMTAKHADAELAKIDETAAEILEAYDSGLEPEDYPVTVTGCDKYGGCPYRDELCKLTTENRFEGLIEMSNLRDLMAKRAKQAKPEPEEPTETEEPTEPEPPPAETKPKRGRPPGTKNKPKDPINPPEQQSLPFDKAPAANGKGFALYVDCLPEKTGREVVSLLAVAAPAMRKAAEAGKVADYRLIDFGKGPGAFAAALRKHLETNPIPDGAAVTLDTKTAEGRDALSTLSDLAGEVIRGI